MGSGAGQVGWGPRATTNIKHGSEKYSEVDVWDGLQHQHLNVGGVMPSSDCLNSIVVSVEPARIGGITRRLTVYHTMHKQTNPAPLAHFPYPQPKPAPCRGVQWHASLALNIGNQASTQTNCTLSPLRRKGRGIQKPLPLGLGAGQVAQSQ